VLVLVRREFVPRGREAATRALQIGAGDQPRPGQKESGREHDGTADTANGGAVRPGHWGHGRGGRGADRQDRYRAGCGAGCAAHLPRHPQRAVGSARRPDVVAAAIHYGPGGALVDAGATMLSSMGEGFAAFSEAFSAGQGFGWHQRTADHWHGTDAFTRVALPTELIASVHCRSSRNAARPTASPASVPSS
jgi:hypothetical protein